MNKRSLQSHAQYDVIIVPGYPFEAPAWDRILQARILWAVHLYKIGATKNIMMSGAANYSPYVEAEIMALYAESLGVPKEHIILETKAEHSTENLWYGYQLAKELGYKNVALASDPFQTKLLMSYGHRRTPEVNFLPVIFDTLKTFPSDTPSIDYQKIRVDTFVHISKKYSKWKRIKGTLGYNIEYNPSISNKSSFYFFKSFNSLSYSVFPTRRYFIQSRITLFLD
jgi:uncharacterized SAM-binding protein YcdF (DUF218 family)